MVGQCCRKVAVVDLHITLADRRDLAGQIYRQIRDAILDGRLTFGQALPPTRELADRVAVSRNTVAAAYDRLTAEGFVGGRVGAGTYVTGGPHPVAMRAGASATDGLLRPRAIWATVDDPPDLSRTWRYDFRTGVPDARLFPYPTWRGLLARELRASAVGTAAYADPAGHPGLRAAIARHLGVSRAVRASASDVLVTNGLQQAIDLLARVLLEPRGVVAVEDPAYLPPTHTLRSHGARVAGVPVDAEGIVVDAIPAAARMVYVTPSHQYPLGLSMSLARRLALLAWAERCGGVIVEDDYDSEFRYAGRPAEPLQSLDRAGRVCYVGSFSKVMLPTLRLGFLVAPPGLVGALRKAKYTSDWHTALPDQAALARFIADGTLAHHIRRMRRVYAARHQLVVSVLRNGLARWLTPIPCATGLHVAASSDVLTVAQLTEIDRTLRQRDVALTPLSTFAIDQPPRAGLLIGYGMVSVDEIPAGLARVRDAFAAY
jgi:GntR family transcriptional regulator/MocR family aminotransferase